MIDQATIDELITLRRDAKISAENFTTAVAEQSEKHDIAKSALRRFVCAAEACKLETLNTETDTLAQLLEEVV